jgi:hypothetical protein
VRGVAGAASLFAEFARPPGRCVRTGHGPRRSALPRGSPTRRYWAAVFFALITTSAIRRGSFTSVKDLVAKIDTFIKNYNANSKPFVWTATADEIPSTSSSDFVSVFPGQNTRYVPAVAMRFQCEVGSVEIRQGGR